MRYLRTDGTHRRGVPVEAYLKKLEEREQQAKHPDTKAAFREQIDSLRQAMSGPSRHQDQNWVREQASKMESDFPALFEK